MEVGFKGPCGPAFQAAWGRAQYRIAEELLRGERLDTLALRVDAPTPTAGAFQVVYRAALAEQLGAERGGDLVRDRIWPGGLWVSISALGVESLVFWAEPGGIVLDHDTRGGVVRAPS